MARAFRSAWSPVARVWLFGVPFGVVFAALGIMAAAFFTVVFSNLSADKERQAWIGFSVLAVVCIALVISAWVTKYRRAGGHLKGEAKRIALGIQQLLYEYPDRASLEPKDEDQVSDYMVRMRGQYAKRGFPEKISNLQRELAKHGWDTDALWKHGYWFSAQNRFDIIQTRQRLEGISMMLD